MISYPFLWHRTFFHPPSTSWEALYISTFPLILRCVLSTNACHICIFHYFEIFFPSICRKHIHNIILTTSKHTKAFITTTSWELTTCLQHLEHFPQLPDICLRYLLLYRTPRVQHFLKAGCMPRRKWEWYKFW